MVAAKQQPTLQFKYFSIYSRTLIPRGLARAAQPACAFMHRMEIPRALALFGNGHKVDMSENLIRFIDGTPKNTYNHV